MRVLLLMRGSAGCGKSTYIENNGLKPYTLCADDIRLLCQSPMLQVDGTEGISQNNEKVVWNTLFRILETRMQRGEFTVIDATNSKTSEMNRYKELAKNYRYRIYCVDMTDIPIEETKRRNAEREELKRVPEEVIDKMYSRFRTQQIPSGIKVLKPDELDTIWYKPINLSSWDKIHVIGDIHGCYSALKEYMDSNGGFKEDEFYIFLGDYIDRGIENAETMKYLCELSKHKNTIFLEGNHERWLWLWAKDTTTPSKEFELRTRVQLEKANIDKKDIREFYRKLGQCGYFVYNGKTFLVTHGGVSSIPYRTTLDEHGDIHYGYNLLSVATEQMIKGVGKYEDADTVDKAFALKTANNIYQIHGHRNITNSPIQTTDRTFNLEGQVKFGGHLRVVQITKNEIVPIEIKNSVFKDPEAEKDEKVELEKVNMDVYSLVDSMRNNKYVNEKNFGRISSFNFTRQAFEKNVWDKITNKARGLFVDTEEYKIVARSYDKFFNINQRPETELSNLRYKLKFPVTAYVKENGFLGIVGWNPEADDLLIASKSTIIGDFAGYFKTLLYSIYGETTMHKMKNYIKENNVSFVFECCDMKNDPHIIEYPESKVVLLDIIYNELEYKKVPYQQLVEIANKMELTVKEKAYELLNWEDFYDWYMDITAEDYKYNGEHIEGFVIEDSVGYMTKIKLHYYNMWKHLRSVAHSTFKTGNYRYSGSLLTPLENEFFGWCKSMYKNMFETDREALRERCYTDICTLRNMFYADREDE